MRPSNGSPRSTARLPTRQSSKNGSCRERQTSSKRSRHWRSTRSPLSYTFHAARRNESAKVRRCSAMPRRSERKARTPHLVPSNRAFTRLVMRSILTLSLMVSLLTAPSAALQVEMLRSAGGLPPHVVGVFEEAVDFQQAADGTYYVFDRRGHAVYSVDAARRAAHKLIEIGGEEGRIIQPTGFDITPDGHIVVADVPRAQQRIQTFNDKGLRETGFFLPGQPAARVMIGNLMLNGAGSVQHTGSTLLISLPE